MASPSPQPSNEQVRLSAMRRSDLTVSQQTELTNVQFFRLTIGVGAFLSFASSVLYFSFSQLLGCVQVAAGLLYLGIYAYSLRAPFITMVRLTVVDSFCIIAAVN
jgi:hypothetical protein